MPLEREQKDFLPENIFESFYFSNEEKGENPFSLKNFNEYAENSSATAYLSEAYALKEFFNGQSTVFKNLQEEKGQAKTFPMEFQSLFHESEKVQSFFESPMEYYDGVFNKANEESTSLNGFLTESFSQGIFRDDGESLENLFDEKNNFKNENFSENGFLNESLKEMQMDFFEGGKNENDLDSIFLNSEKNAYGTDMAEKSIVVNMNNTFGDIRETADVDKIILKLRAALERELLTSAEGVYR